MKEKIIEHFKGNYRPFYGRYLPELKKVKGNEFRSLCCFHDEKNPSLNVNVKTGKFYCHGCGAKGFIFDFYAEKHGLNGDFKAILNGIAADFGIEKPTQRQRVQSYIYLDADGKPRHQTVKTKPKSFYQEHRKNGKWVKGLNGIEPFLYRLPEVIKAKEVTIVEGEKDADNLKKLGFTATTNAMGAGKWRDQYNQYLKDKHVVLIPDNDAEGRGHMNKIAIALYGQVASLKMIELPDLPAKGDVSDFIQTFENPESAAERLSVLIENAEPWKPKIYLPNGKELKGYTAAELMKRDFPEPKWAIPGILPEGLNLMAGKPKHGKSIAALGMGISISSGGKAFGKIEVEKGAVLYLALEDTHRRLKNRLKQMLTDQDRPSEKLLLFTEWPRMYLGGINLMEQKVKENPDMRLIIIDTLPKFRPPRQKNISPYDFDYMIGTKLKEFADAYQVPVLVICHLRKTESDDRMDDISGTFGVTGSADGILALIRKTGQADAELHVTGRDVEAAEYALTFDSAHLSWNLLGMAHEVKNSHEQQAVYDLLKDSNESLSLKDIQKFTDVNYNTVKKAIEKFQKDGTIVKTGYGKYRLSAALSVIK